MLGVPQPNANSMSSANYKDVSFLLHLGGGGGAGRSGEYAERTLKHTGFEVPVGYQMEILVGQHLALWEGQQVREWD